MALSIGVSTGSRIDVAGHLVEVKSIQDPNLIVITVDGGTPIVLQEQQRQEILPGVFVFSGVGEQGGANRIAFEAPQAIRISRLERSRR